MTFVMTGAGSCTPSLEQACRSHIPEFQQNVSDALTVLLAWDPGPVAGRAVADEGEVPAVAVAKADRESWEHWAEARLVEVQHYVDIAQVAHAEAARADLSALATELVTFHGLAQRGRLDRMVASLKRIDASAASARREACEAF